MNAAQTAATFEIRTTPVLACDDELCMSCAGDGVCAAARKQIHEIERESAAGEARLAEVEAEYDASRSASVPQDGPVVSSLTRAGAAALVDVLALLLGDGVVPPPPVKTPAPRQRARVKRSPRPAVSATAARAATPALNAHQRQVLVWMAAHKHQRVHYYLLGEWVISCEGKLLGTTRSSTVRLLEKRGMIQQLRGEGERRYLTEAGLRVARAQMAEAEAA